MYGDKMLEKYKEKYGDQFDEWFNADFANGQKAPSFLPQHQWDQMLADPVKYANDFLVFLVKIYQ